MPGAFSRGFLEPEHLQVCVACYVLRAQLQVYLLMTLLTKAACLGWGLAVHLSVRAAGGGLRRERAPFPGMSSRFFCPGGRQETS